MTALRRAPLHRGPLRAPLGRRSSGRSPTASVRRVPGPRSAFAANPEIHVAAPSSEPDDEPLLRRPFNRQPRGARMSRRCAELQDDVSTTAAGGPAQRGRP